LSCTSIRPHTISTRDWCSDVCSSDLVVVVVFLTEDLHRFEEESDVLAREPRDDTLKILCWNARPPGVPSDRPASSRVVCNLEYRALPLGTGRVDRPTGHGFDDQVAESASIRSRRIRDFRLAQLRQPRIRLSRV